MSYFEAPNDYLTALANYEAAEKRLTAAACLEEMDAACG